MDIVDEIKTLQQRLCELNQQLASRGAAQKLPDQEAGLLLGRLDAQPVALLLSAVDEVFPAASLAPLPGAPDWVAGVLDFRGELIPVVDALARVRSVGRELALSDFIVLCRVHRRRVGVILQDVTDVRTVARSAIEPPPSGVPFAPYVLGVIHRSSQPALLLDTAVLTSGLDVEASTP